MTSALRIGIGLAVAVVFGVAMWRATLAEQSVRCELCIEFEGRRACREGAGSDQDMAVRAARSAACAVLSNGVTQGMQCDRMPPASMQCDGP